MCFMAVYYTIRCPKCNQTVEQGKNRSKRFGSPLRNCRFCGSTFVDKDYIEAGLFTERQLKLQVLSLYSWQIAMALFLIFLGLVAIAKSGPLICLVMFVLGGLIIVKVYRDYCFDIDQLPKEINKSNERLANPYYVLALHKANISVPKSMIDRAIRDISKDEQS